MSAFLSAPYLLLLALAFLLRWGLPKIFHRPGWLLLSYAFYWLQGPWLPLILALLTLATIGGCARLRATGSGPRRQGLLAFFVALALVPFFSTKIGGVAHWTATVGLSFASFNAIACLSAAYFDDALRPSAGDLALQLAFFPKLLQGPLAGPEETVPQFADPSPAQEVLFQEGFQRFLWGAFQKAVIADRIGAFIDPLWAPNTGLGGGAAALGLYLFAGQIYFDLKGYTDMAIGSALLLGIRLPENFERPYFSRSVAEFWKRWHMTFSRWLLHHVFEPLQMAWRDFGTLGSAAALFSAFTLVGLWHGFNGRFLVFGVYHGALVASSLFVGAPLKRFYKRTGLWQRPVLAWGQVAVTFHLVLLSLILFHSQDLAQAGDLLRSLLHGLRAPGADWENLKAWLQVPGRSQDLGLLGALLFLAGLCGALAPRTHWKRWPLALRWSAYWALALAILFLGRLETAKEFIYAQF
jgi:D-alanyl-lipoteichoic acid acyltransferase DltB (MBOAT superfamily)